jgi:hypothetical protein
MSDHPRTIRNLQFYSSLRKAVKRGDYRKTNKLLNMPKSFYAREEQKYSTDISSSFLDELMCFASKTNLKTICLLIERGATISNEFLYKTITATYHDNQAKIIKYFLEGGYYEEVSESQERSWKLIRSTNFSYENPSCDCDIFDEHPIFFYIYDARIMNIFILHGGLDIQTYCKELLKFNIQEYIERNENFDSRFIKLLLENTVYNNIPYNDIINYILKFIRSEAISVDKCPCPKKSVCCLENIPFDRWRCKTLYFENIENVHLTVRKDIKLFVDCLEECHLQSVVEGIIERLCMGPYSNRYKISSHPLKFNLLCYILYSRRLKNTQLKNIISKEKFQRLLVYMGLCYSQYSNRIGNDKCFNYGFEYKLFQEYDRKNIHQLTSLLVDYYDLNVYFIVEKEFDIGLCITRDWFGKRMIDVIPEEYKNFIEESCSLFMKEPE